MHFLLSYRMVALLPNVRLAIQLYLLVCTAVSVSLMLDTACPIFAGRGLLNAGELSLAVDFVLLRCLHCFL